MNFFTNLNDDQIALLGCAAALLFTGTTMSLSYFIGRWRFPEAPAFSGAALIPARAAAEIASADIAGHSPKRRSAA